MTMINRNKGITLIELMIVVVIVAILGSVAVPAYQDHVIRAKRSDAKAALLDTANKLDKALYTWGNYNNGGAVTVVTDIPGASATSPEGYYTLSFGLISTVAYRVTATPTGSHSDATCGALSFDQAGLKTATGDDQQCWR